MYVMYIVHYEIKILAIFFNTFRVWRFSSKETPPCRQSAVLMKDLKLNLTSSAVAAASILIF